MSIDYSGVYRGRVECVDDPLRLGRVRVRIPSMHGVPEDNDNYDNCIPPDQLPWARLSTPFPSGYDYGSLVVPEVGSYVYLMYECGTTSLVCIGGCYGRDAQNLKPLGSLVEDDSSTKYSSSGGKWYSPVMHNEVPKDYQLGLDNKRRPNISVIYKSPKGASVLINEEDDNESITLLDRLGNALRFLSPVSKSDNFLNGKSRGVKSSITEDSIPDDYSSRKPFGTILKTISGQVFRLLSFPKTRSRVLELVNKSEYNSNKSSGIYSICSDEDSVINVFSKNGDLLSRVSISSNSITVSSGDNLIHLSESSTYIKSDNLVLDVDTIETRAKITTTNTITPPEVNEFDWDDSKIECHMELGGEVVDR